MAAEFYVRYLLRAYGFENTAARLEPRYVRYMHAAHTCMYWELFLWERGVHTTGCEQQEAPTRNLKTSSGGLCTTDRYVHVLTCTRSQTFLCLGGREWAQTTLPLPLQPKMAAEFYVRYLLRAYAWTTRRPG